jgi:hypothetical protein
MRFAHGILLVFLLAVGVLLSIGCSDDSTTPEKKSTPSTEMDYVWSKSFGDAAQDQRVQGVATDASGNVYIAGYYNGTVNFGGATLTSAGSWDVFIAKFNASGAYVWSASYGAVDYQRALAIAVDGSGNVIIAGNMAGSTNFGGGALTSPGGLDAFVAKFDSDGTHIWSKNFGDASDQDARAVAVDGTGNVFIAGAFKGSINFGGGALTSAGNNDIFIAKLAAANGAHVWSKRFGGSADDYVQGVAADGSGNAIIVGTSQGNIDFGGGTLTSAGGPDMFAAKLAAADGAHAWSKLFGDASGQYGEAVAVDATGNAYVTGDFSGTIDFGGGTLTSAGSTDIAVAKLAATDGAYVWSKRFGDASSQAPLTVDVSATGYVILAGRYAGTVNFGGNSLTSAGGEDVFVAKFGSDGAHRWSGRFGGLSDQSAEAATYDVSGNVIIGGRFAGTVDFGGGTLTSAGNIDAFVAKFSH